MTFSLYRYKGPVFERAAHHLENVKCVAHHLEIFQTHHTPPRNIMASEKTVCKEEPRPCDFFGGRGVASSRQ